MKRQMNLNFVEMIHIFLTVNIRNGLTKVPEIILTCYVVSAERIKIGLQSVANFT